MTGKKLSVTFLTVSLLTTGALFQRASAQLAASILNWDGNFGTLVALPQYLSESGFDPGNSTVFVPYEVNVPQYRNLMTAQRYVSVPAGTSIIPGDSIDYTYPAGTAFIRVISRDTVYGDPSTNKKIEVQIQIRSADNQWHRLAYVYNEEETDAELSNGTKLFYKKYTTNIQGQGLPYFDDVTKEPADVVEFTYLRLVTNCDNSCHWNTSANGFITQQLNRGNQLQELVDKGVLQHLPDLAGMTTKNMILKWVNKTDTSASLEERVLSYLGGNCSHCHNHLPERENAAMLSRSFTHFRPPAEPFPEFMNEAWTVTPGKPDSSPIISRMILSNMPGGAEVSLPDAYAIDMLWDWVNSLDGDPGNDVSYESWVDIEERNEHRPASQFNASYKNGMLRLNNRPPGIVRLYTLKGQSIALRKISDRCYHVSESLDPGIYFLKTGESVALLPVR